MRAPIVAVVAASAALAVACGHAPAAHRSAVGSPSPAAAPVASAAPTAPDARVGALFVGGGTMHTCSAAVLDSPSGDLILTAAHCLPAGADATFVPGFRDDAAPDDTWHLDAVFLDPRWVADQDPAADYAIARVSRATGGTPEQQAGGGFVLGRTPGSGAAVTVTGYGMGVGGGPISCHATVAGADDGFPSLPCAGLVAGVSGAPWTTGTAVAGLVGGLDGGGCDEDLSYSPPFDDGIGALLARAEAGGPGDTAPQSFDDGC
jgi:hypothetical protein